jgi:probable F420-dependent oxidoreductase
MDALRPFRFGISTRGGPDPAAWQALARRVEELGYSSLVVPDHVYTPLAPIAALAHAAAATTTLRLGAHVLGNDFRNPVMLAKELATLDVLSGGRLELGLGTGWLRVDYDATGIPLDPPGIRVGRLAEALAIVKGCFGDEPFAFSGAHYTVRDLNLLPKPVQRPRPPILVGGGGRRVLTLAAREADIVALNFRTTPEGGWDASDFSAQAVERKVAWVREAAGERRRDLELSAFAAFVEVTEEEPRRVAERILADWRLGDHVSADQLLAWPQALIGSAERIVETLQDRRRRFGISYVVARDSDAGSGSSVMEAFAPVVARLAGT